MQHGRDAGLAEAAAQSGERRHGSGLDVEWIPLPVGGGAPAWRAGIVVARRQQARRDDARLAA